MTFRDELLAGGAQGREGQREGERERREEGEVRVRRPRESG